MVSVSSIPPPVEIPLGSKLHEPKKNRKRDNMDKKVGDEKSPAVDNEADEGEEGGNKNAKPKEI